MGKKEKPKAKYIRLNSEESAAQFLNETFGADSGELVAAAQMGLELAELFEILGDASLEKAFEFFEHFRGPFPVGEWKTRGFESGNWSGAEVLGTCMVRDAARSVPVLSPLAERLPALIDELALIDRFARVSRLRAHVDQLVQPLSAAQRRDAFKKLSSPLNMACACVLLVAEAKRFEKYPSPLELAAIFVLVGDPRLDDFIAAQDEATERDELSKRQSARKTMKKKVLDEVLEIVRRLTGSTAPPL